MFESKKLSLKIIVKIYIFEGVENPALKIVYDEIIDKAEKYSGPNNFFAALVALQFVMIPKFATSLFVYFTTNLGDDGLELPIPMWCAC